MKYYIIRVNDAGEIDGIPEEVIICKDCKWYEIDKPHYCGFGGHGYRLENDFCSDAERREE